MPDKKKLVIANINTSPERTYIEIDGKDYGCITADEMELKHLNQLQRMQRRMAAGLDDESDDDTQELSEIMDKMVRIILVDCPDAVHKKLRDMHRMEIIRAFTEAASPSQTTPQTDPSIDESQGSPASTEVALIAG